MTFPLLTKFKEQNRHLVFMNISEYKLFELSTWLEKLYINITSDVYMKMSEKNCEMLIVRLSHKEIRKLYLVIPV